MTFWRGITFLPDEIFIELIVHTGIALTVEKTRTFTFILFDFYVPERSIMYVTVSACFLIRFAFRGF